MFSFHYFQQCVLVFFDIYYIDIRICFEFLCRFFFISNVIYVKSQSNNFVNKVLNNENQEGRQNMLTFDFTLLFEALVTMY
jgi:hypothetical protein